MFERRRDSGRGGETAPSWFSHPGWTRWIAHVAFWAGYLALRTVAASAMRPPDELQYFPFMANRAAVAAAYFVTTGVLLALIMIFLDKRAAWIRNAALIGGALALAPLTHYCEKLFPYLLGHAHQDFPFLSYIFAYGWVLPLWALTQMLIDYHFQSIAQARAISRAQTLAHDAQIRMLHYQINPHFLFNTLNAISTLVLDQQAEQAEKMLLRLAGFLRYSLDRQPTELAALSAELEAQRKYLEIEQTRFGDKLKVHFDIEPGLETAKLPSLILQPILENAIKYAITPNPDGGSIHVRAYRDHGLLRVCVEDDGPGLAPDGPRRRRGVGLANAHERLTLIYGDRAGLSAKNRDPRGARIDIWLPFEEEKVARTIAPSLS